MLAQVITLREGGPADLPAMRDCFRAAVRELGAAHYDAAQRAVWAAAADDPQGWSGRMADESVLLAEQGAALLGLIAWRADGYIDMLYVAPAAARRGVARTLHTVCEQRLRAAGCAELFTDASLVAQPFFLDQGYELVAREVVRRGAVELPRARLRKILSLPAP